MLHMVSDHVILPLGIVALVWMPARLARRLEGDTTEPALSGVGYGTTSG